MTYFREIVEGQDFIFIGYNSVVHICVSFSVITASVIPEFQYQHHNNTFFLDTLVWGI